jgi:DNA invertase Pin-like site-specific DNA recombinase
MKYGYVSNDEHTEQDPRIPFMNALKEHHIVLDELIDDVQANKIHWDRRALKELLDTKLQAGDELICYESSNLARSTQQVLEIVDILVKKGVTLHLLKHQDRLVPQEVVNTQAFLQIVQHIEEDFVARRTTDALARRKAAGLPLGRPKGRRNKSRKLDSHKMEIKRFLALNISKASIAKLVGCHAQTLYNYIDDLGLDEEARRERPQLLLNCQMPEGIAVRGRPKGSRNGMRRLESVGSDS